jgi:transketolase
MRTTFINELTTLTATNNNIHLIVGDLGFSVIEDFQTKYPENFLNAGVAEQNMTGVAAGMASEDCHVFTYSIANFPTFRCAEQIRNDIDYHNFPVTIVVVGAGVAYGALGYSHHAVQDYALMRTMPNMLIAAPGDPFEVKACVNYLINNPQPSYLRLGKNGEKNFNLNVPLIEPGHWNLINKSTNPTNKIAIVTTGTVLNRALLVNENLDYDVFSLPLWGMRCKDQQLEYISRYDKIITIEDHLLDAGFGSWMLESLSKDPQERLKIKSFGLSQEVCGMVGEQETLMDACLNLNELMISG